MENGKIRNHTESEWEFSLRNNPWPRAPQYTLMVLEYENDQPHMQYVKKSSSFFDSIFFKESLKFQ